MNQYRAIIDRWYLDTDTVNKRVDTFGNKVMIVGSSAEAVTIYVEAKGSNLQGTGSLPLQNRDWLATPIIFEQLSLTWAAQPGQWIDVLVLILDPAPVQFEYVRQQRGTIDSIANTVMVLEKPSSSFQTSRPTVGTTGGLILPADPTRKKVTITNTSSANGFFITSTNVVTDGHYVGPLCSLDIDTTAEIWGYTASGTSSPTVLVQF